MENKNVWRKCAVCKKEIEYQSIYQVCTVSNCRKSVFCSVKCWDVHCGVMNHKSAGAEEEEAPSKVETEQPRRILVSNKQKNKDMDASNNKDILVVASKLKNYIKTKHDVNTSGNVMPVLSDIIRIISDSAVENAKADGRKTLMNRDFDTVSFK